MSDGEMLLAMARSIFLGACCGGIVGLAWWLFTSRRTESMAKLSDLPALTTGQPSWIIADSGNYPSIAPDFKVNAPLPPWAIEPDYQRGCSMPSLLGMLWMRLGRRAASQLQRSSHPNTVFQTGKLAVLSAVKGKLKDDQIEGVVITVSTPDHLLLWFHDDVGLYPSDQLVTQLTVLADTLGG